MKKLQSITGIALIALMLIAGSSYAQRGNRANRSNRSLDRYRNIPNLTEQQNQQIQQLRSAHLKEVDQLRQERRSTTDRGKKNEIRQQMLQKQQGHREKIRALLSEEQKTYFDKNYRQNSNSSPRGKARGRSTMRDSGGCRKARGGSNRSW